MAKQSLTISPTVTSFIIILGMVSVVGWFGILPQAKKVGSVTASINQLKEAITAATPTPTPVTTGTASTSDKDLAATLLPTTDAQYDLIVQLESYSRFMNMPLSSLTIGSPAGTTPLTTTGSAAAAADASSVTKKTAIALSIGGTYDAIQRYISGLTRLGRFIQVDQVSLSRVGTGQSANPTMNAVITAYAYYMPAATSATPTPAAAAATAATAAPSSGSNVPQ